MAKDNGKVASSFPPRGWRRGEARAARTEARASGPESKAVGPGLMGGAYKPLSDHEVQLIHATALDVLETIGVADPLPEMLDPALPRGCRLNEHDRLCFPRALVEDALAGACESFTIYGRDPAFDLELGGTKVHHSTAGQAVTIYDPETRSYRPSKLADLYDLARLKTARGGVWHPSTVYNLLSRTQLSRREAPESSVQPYAVHA